MKEKLSAKEWNKKGAKAQKDRLLPLAMYDFANALKLDPKNKKALSEIKKLEVMMTSNDWSYDAFMYVQMQKHAEALPYYEKALECSPKSATAWTGKGVCYIAMGESSPSAGESKDNYEAAILCFERALAISSKDPVIWNNKKVALNQCGNKLLELGDYDKALEYYLKSQEIPGPGVTPQIMAYNVKNAWSLKGSVFYQAAKYSEALDCYKRALIVTPAREDKDKEILGNMKEAAHKRGIELHNEGNYAEAIQCFDLVLAIDSQHKDAWLWKGCGLQTQGNYAEAIQCFDKTLAIDPKDKGAWLWKAMALGDQGYYTDAMSCLNIALTLDSNDSEIWGYKGFYLYRQGKYAEAMQCFDRELTLSPENASSLKNKGLVLFCQGHYDDALEYFKKAIKINPKPMSALQGQAVWFFYHEEKQKSEQLFAEVELLAQTEKSKTTLASIWCQRGDLFFSINAFPQAMEAFRRAQSVIPGYFYAEQRLRDIPPKSIAAQILEIESIDAQLAALKQKQRDDFNNAFHNQGAVEAAMNYGRGKTEGKTGRLAPLSEEHKAEIREKWGNFTMTPDLQDKLDKQYAETLGRSEKAVNMFIKSRKMRETEDLATAARLEDLKKAQAVVPQPASPSFGKNPTVKVLFPQPSAQAKAPAPPPPPPPKPALPPKKTYTKK